MIQATASHKRPFWPSDPGVFTLAFLIVAIVISSTGCSLIDDWIQSYRGYNSNDATMENWGNPTTWGERPSQGTP